MTSELKDKTPITNIQVGANGLKVTWNVLAIVAAMGLGLYATTIVAPIKAEQEDLDNRLTIVEQEHKKYADIVNEHRRDQAAMHATLDQQVQEFGKHMSSDEKQKDSFDTRLLRLETRGD